MAKGFKHGGSQPLNFKVIGNPQPETAKENTIWVDTDEKITGFVFRETEPENKIHGMVWITVGPYSKAEMNILKKAGTGLYVYPLSAKQWVNDAWENKTAASYLNGEWVEWFVWDGVLYNSGNEYAEITGGWTVSGRAEKRSSSIYVGASMVANFSGTATHNEPVALNGQGTLKINFTYGTGGGGGKSTIYIYVKDKDGFTVASLLAWNKSMSSGAAVKTLDISNLPAGKYKVSVVAANTSDSEQICYAEFNRVEVV